MGFRRSGKPPLSGPQTSRAARIVMTTLILPEGNAFGVDDIDSCSPYVEHPGENRRKRVLRVGHSNRAQMGHSSRAPRVPRAKLHLRTDTANWSEA